MYGAYHYKQNATIANIMADLVAMLTGTTNVANLSADCEQGLTEINTSENPAGWVMHDNINEISVVLKAPFADDPLVYKYCRLHAIANGSVNYFIHTTLYETWSAGSHSGTNKAAYSDDNQWAQWVHLNQSGGGKVFLSASARHVMLASLYGSTWGSNNSGPVGILERTRELGFDTPARGFPPVVWSGFSQFTVASTQYETMPRILTYQNTEATGTGAICQFVHPAMNPGGGGLPDGVRGEYPDGAGGWIIPFYPLMVKYSELPAILGEVSTLCHVWHLPSGMGVLLDTILMDGKTYVLWRQENGNNGMIAVLRG